MTHVVRHKPGILLLRPAPVGAAAVVALNDFVLKPRAPGLVSGKLSDFAICFLLPVLLVSSWEWLRWLARRPAAPPSRLAIAVAVIVTALYFAGLQLSALVASTHVEVLTRLFGSFGFTVTRDVSDLIALPCCLLSWYWLRRQADPELTPPHPRRGPRRRR